MNIYFEGFDTQIRPSDVSGLNAGGDCDIDTFWFGGTPVRHLYTQGYGPGRAIQFRRRANFSSSWRSRVFEDRRRFRAGMWFQANVNPGYPNKVLMTIGRPDSYHVVIMDTDARIGMNHVTSTLTGAPLIDSSHLQVAPNSWNYLEVFVDGVTGHAEFAVNAGSIHYTGGKPWGGNWVTWGFMLPYTGSQDNFVTIDHLWATEGERPPRQSVSSVAVQAGADRMEGSNGFRGVLTAGEDMYRTYWVQPNVGSQSVPTIGENVTSTSNFYFPRSPRNNQPWSRAELNSYDGWGVCFQEFNSSTIGRERDYVRLDVLGLMILEFDQDAPFVRTYPPTVLKYLSGPWERTLANQTILSHANVHPRPNVTLAEAVSLRVNAPGCLLAKYTPDGPPPDQMLFTVGVTFAEEFRIDHNDWTNTVGEGVPYDSYFVTGYGIYAEGNKKTQGNYINVNYEEEISGGAYLQACWDYALDPNTGRWSQRQQVYKTYTGDYKHNSRRLKLRGHGKTLQLRVTNDGDRPFGINGWSMMVSANSSL